MTSTEVTITPVLSLDALNESDKEGRLAAIAQEYGALTIDGPGDKEGYDRVHKARMDLRALRVGITKTGEELRKETTAFNKAVIAKEKELVAKIEPTERHLEALEVAIDDQRERESRMKHLPDRKAKLKDVGAEMDDDDILDLDTAQFNALLETERAKRIREKELELEAREKKLKDEERKETERKAKAQEAPVVQRVATAIADAVRPAPAATATLKRWKVMVTYSVGEIEAPNKGEAVDVARALVVSALGTGLDDATIAVVPV